MQYDTPGFLPNGRIHRGTPDEDQCCFFSNDAVHHFFFSSLAMGLATVEVMQAMHRTWSNSKVRVNGKTRQMQWRDMFDIAVKWRRWGLLNISRSIAASCPGDHKSARGKDKEGTGWGGKPFLCPQRFYVKLATPNQELPLSLSRKRRVSPAGLCSASLSEGGLSFGADRRFRLLLLCSGLQIRTSQSCG